MNPSEGRAQFYAARNSMPFGAEFASGGDARFRLRAPACEHAGLEIEGQGSPLPLTALSAGLHEVTTNTAKCGARYRFVLPDGTRVPDPASPAG